MDDRALETRVRHISDSDLLRALNLRLDPMEPWAAWREYLLAHLGRRRLPSAGDDPTEATELIRAADRVVRRDIACWGGVRIRYRGEVDFSRNLGGSANYGFHYFGWIRPLGAAWRNTGKERYARAFVDIFRQWYGQRDLVRGDIPRFDVIWYELGCGARAPVLTELYLATLESRAARDPAYHRDMLKTVLGHGRWLYDHETAFRHGNFQVTGARALLYLGLAFPELRESRRWIARGLRYVVAHAERDVHADGCHMERAPHYHLGVARNLVSTLELVAGKRELADAARRLRSAGRRMLRWTVSVMTPSRHSPVVGDSEYDVPAAQLERDGRILRDPLLAWAARPAPPGRLPAGQGPARSTVLAASGFVVVRSGWGVEDLWFLLNYGPWGGGHSHAEALAFQLWSHGLPLAADCGRGVSYDDPLHRSWYVTPYAHNMVVVDGREPSVAGRRGRLLFHTSSGGTHLLGLRHQGYRDFGVHHRRCFIVSERRRYVVVLDFLRSRREHRYEWVLNTPVRGLRTGVGRARGRGLWVLSADPAAVGTPEARRVRMCLPLEGRTTWGLPRGEGTNLRFGAGGSSLDFGFLLMPGESAGGVRFEVELDGRRGTAGTVTVVTPAFTDRWAVDCLEGSLRRLGS